MTEPQPRRRGIDPATAVLSVFTLVAFAAATVMRFLVGVIDAEGDTASGTTSASASPDPFATADTLSVVAAAAIGAGILLFAATLVLAVVRHRPGRLPLTIGVCTLLVTLVAVATVLFPMRPDDLGPALQLATVRTALIALAGACLPAVVVGAIGSRGRPRRA